MEPHPERRIVFADRLDNSVVIGFDDGKTALYSAALLYATLPNAQEMIEPGDDE